LRSRDSKAARAGMQKMLALNPSDNHGMRDYLVNMLLEAGESGEALQLVERYPDDAGAGICFGAVLAHFRLGEIDSARAALKSALRFHPKVPEYLLKPNLPKPRIDDFGVSFGGDDEAWSYREDMAETWAATPGALEWLEHQVQTHRHRAAGRKKHRHRGP
jgi:hypothetical protein